MTKFVAALFLPVMLAAATALLPAARQRLVSDCSRWVLAAVFVVALAAPWFVYQQLRVGNQLWDIIFGVHVYKRFTALLDPAHIHPVELLLRRDRTASSAHGHGLARVGRHRAARAVRVRERRFEAVQWSCG